MRKMTEKSDNICCYDTQPAFTYTKLAIETLEPDLKYVQS